MATDLIPGSAARSAPRPMGDDTDAVRERTSSVPPVADARRTRLRWLLILLAFLGVVTGGLSVAAGPLTLSLERILGLALIPLLLAHLLMSFGPRGPRRLLWLWSAWLALLLFSALLTSDFIGHLIPFASAVIPVAYFSLLTIGPVDGAKIDRIARRLLLAHVVLGVPILLLRRAQGPNALTAPFVDQLGRVKLLSIEPNLLGSILCFLVLLTLPRARWSFGNVLLYTLSLVLLVGTFSKMPLAAFAFSVVLYAVLRAIARRRGGVMALAVPLWIGAAAISLTLAILPMFQKIYVQLLDRSDAVSSRLYLYRLALQRFEESPIIGRGPGDFRFQGLSVLKAVGAYDQENLWIGQMMLAILHDSGILGVILYLVFLVALFCRGGKWINAGSIDHCSYVAAFAGILAASQATTAHLTSLFGISAGLVGSVPFVLSARHGKTGHG